MILDRLFDRKKQTSLKYRLEFIDSMRPRVFVFFSVVVILHRSPMRQSIFSGKSHVVTVTTLLPGRRLRHYSEQRIRRGCDASCRPEQLLLQLRYLVPGLGQLPRREAYVHLTERIWAAGIDIKVGGRGSCQNLFLFRLSGEQLRFQEDVVVLIVILPRAFVSMLAVAAVAVLGGT